MMILEPQTRDLLPDGGTPPLGEIARKARGVLHNQQVDGWTDEALLCLYDRVFEGRPDYRLWRVACFARFPSELSIAWLDVQPAAEAGLASTDPIVVFGTSSVISSLVLRGIPQCVSPLLLPEHVEHLAEIANRRVIESWSLPHYEASSAVARVLASAAHRKVQGRKGGSLSREALEEFLTRLDSDLATSDFTWEPGRTLSFRELRREARAGKRLLPFTPIELDHLLARAIGEAREAIRSFVQPTSPLDDSLLERRARYAFSAWRLLRCARRGHPSKQHREQSPSPAELDALRRLVHATRDAGWPLLSAGLAHLLLRLVPDNRVSDYAWLGHNLSFTIRQCGLQVDRRFHRPKAQNIVGTSRAQTEAYYLGNRVLTRATSRDLFRIRIQHDHIRDPDWISVLQVYPVIDGNPLSPLEAMRKDVKRGISVSNDLLRSGFLLSLSYGLIKWAATLLSVLPPSLDDLTRFTLLVQRTQEVMPFGIDSRRQTKWHRIIRNVWRQLGSDAPLSFDDALLLHEALLGRRMSLIRRTAGHSDSEQATRLFTRRYYKRLFGAALRSSLENHPAASKSAIPSVVQPDLLGECLQDLTRTDSEVVVYTSIVWLGGAEFSIFAVGQEGAWTERRLPITISKDIVAAAERLSATSTLWATKGVPWGATLTAFGHELAEIAELVSPAPRATARLDEAGRWLLLAIDPRLPALPWQDLMSSIDPQTVVARVPCLSWTVFTWAHDKEKKASARKKTEPHDSPSKLTTILSPSEDILELCKAIEADESVLEDGLDDALIVVGHGAVRKGELPRVPRENALSTGQWIKLGDHRLAIIHACHGGRVSHEFLGDMAGIPGLLLSLDCRLVCAPVAEVSPDTALALHRHLISRLGGRVFGWRYRAAIADNPSVALYQLYGFPHERVRFGLPVLGRIRLLRRRFSFKKVWPARVVRPSSEWSIPSPLPALDFSLEDMLAAVERDKIIAKASNADIRSLSGIHVRRGRGRNGYSSGK